MVWELVTLFRSQGVLQNVGVFWECTSACSVQQPWFSCVWLWCCIGEVCLKLKHLSSVGITGEFRLLGHTTLYANLCRVTCDNLALNSLLGFTESFSGSYFCTLCCALVMKFRLISGKNCLLRELLLNRVETW